MSWKNNPVPPVAGALAYSFIPSAGTTDPVVIVSVMLSLTSIPAVPGGGKYQELSMQ